MALLLFLGTGFSQSDEQLKVDGEIPRAIHEIHSRLFNNYYGFKRANAPEGFIIGRGLAFFPLPAPSIDELLTTMACSADAIVVAAIGTSEASLASDEQSTFTDSLAKIREVVKDNPKQNLSPDRVIVIGRPGGEVEVQPGKKFRVIDENSPPFAKGGGEYLIFMHYVEESKQYISTGDIYKVEGTSFKAVDSPDVGQYDFSRLKAIARDASCQRK